MSEASIKKEALTKINYLYQRLDRKNIGNHEYERTMQDALNIISLFKTNETSTVEDMSFYGKLLLCIGEEEEARDVLSSALKKTGLRNITLNLESLYWRVNTRPSLRDVQSGVALSFILDNIDINSVLDVGSGGGEHALEFARSGRMVHCVDFGVSVYARNSTAIGVLDELPSVRRSVGDFMTMRIEETYDLVWCSHVLEHQPNANLFLRRCLSLIKDEGWLAITVPPLKHFIVGGHVSLWNAGLVLYQLVMAGNDCSEAIVMNYDYNVTIIVRRRPIKVPHLDYDSGDINRLASFFPPNCTENFDGRMLGYSVKMR